MPRKGRVTRELSHLAGRLYGWSSWRGWISGTAGNAAGGGSGRARYEEEGWFSGNTCLTCGQPFVFESIREVRYLECQAGERRR